jgi:hypothetical protein
VELDEAFAEVSLGMAIVVEPIVAVVGEEEPASEILDVEEVVVVVEVDVDEDNDGDADVSSGIICKEAA